ncbi:unnamed protein product, partial [Darwinula stevensoni]
RYKFWVLVLTFLCYTSYHLSRKPLSVVKNVLGQNCTGTPHATVTDQNVDSEAHCAWAPFDGVNADQLLGTLDSAFLFAYAAGMFIRTSSEKGVFTILVLLKCMPFIDFCTIPWEISRPILSYPLGPAKSLVPSAKSLSTTSSISSYALFVVEIGLLCNIDSKPINEESLKDNNRVCVCVCDQVIFFHCSGPVAERVNLRYFLSLGMIFSGIFTYMFGIARNFRIHVFSYYLFIQVLAGFFQSTGWPGVVTCVGNWYGRKKRGLIFGVWNSHTSLGNILGSLIAGIFLDMDWGLSFIIPGVIIAVGGFLVFLTLVPTPEEVGCEDPDYHDDKGVRVNKHSFVNSSAMASERDEESHVADGDEEPLLPGTEAMGTRTMSSLASFTASREKAISFTDALKIPGVAEFSLCLFFAKLVSYTFLYWLPRYIKDKAHFSNTLSAYVSTLFDVGGIFGGITAGFVSDMSQMSASVCTTMLFLAGHLMFIYDRFGSVSIGVNVSLLVLMGFLVNGPYSLITTAVSAELGTHHSLRGNSRALATVTSIIDGTGSVGAAIGPLLAGLITKTGWDKVFYMLIASDICAMFFLVRLVKKEVRVWWISRRARY